MNYAGKFVLLASMHQKEQVIEPVFRQALGCHLTVAGIDTDQFGTFTGEVPRSLSAYETCILKAQQAAQKKNYALSLASEGSFGSHPSNPYLPHAHEMMAFVDLEHHWIIGEQLQTSVTNYKMLTIRRETPLDSFLNSALFPSHALTLQSADRLHVIAKGIRSPHQLQLSLTDGFKKYDELLIATDMRAMMNPTRMQTIGELAKKLATRINRSCRGCGAPGFGFKSVGGHLPCSDCGEITKLYQYEEWGCIQCDYQEQRPRQDNLSAADPTHCDACNP